MNTIMLHKYIKRGRLVCIDEMDEYVRENARWFNRNANIFIEFYC